MSIKIELCGMYFEVTKIFLFLCVKLRGGRGGGGGGGGGKRKQTQNSLSFLCQSAVSRPLKQSANKRTKAHSISQTLRYYVFVCPCALLSKFYNRHKIVVSIRRPVSIPVSTGQNAGCSLQPK
jgi:hypothetical protein